MTGTFILSLDTEIAWGTYSPGDMAARAGTFNDYPHLLRQLVGLLDAYKIPATWAVVGALLLPPDDSLPVSQAHYSFAQQPDARRVREQSLGWFRAPYLLEMMMSGQTSHDIGTHTFTHLLADDPAVTEAMFDAELAAVVHIHQQVGLPPPRSLVYPQNRVAYTHLLCNHGIRVYRGVASDWYAGWPRMLKRSAHLIDRTLALTPPTYRPPTGEVPVNLPASQFLMSYDGIRARIPTQSRVTQAVRGLNRAVAHGETFHLWFHPFNLGSSPAMFEAFEGILRAAAALRDSGQLQIRTMADVAA